MSTLILTISNIYPKAISNQTHIKNLTRLKPTKNHKLHQLPFHIIPSRSDYDIHHRRRPKSKLPTAHFENKSKAATKTHTHTRIHATPQDKLFEIMLAICDGAVSRLCAVRISDTGTAHMENRSRFYERVPVTRSRVLRKYLTGNGISRGQTITAVTLSWTENCVHFCCAGSNSQISAE